MNRTFVMILILTMNACLPKSAPSKDQSRAHDMQAGALYKVFDVASFEKQRTWLRRLEKGTRTASLSLLTLPGKLQCDLPLEGSRVLYVKLQEEELFRINRHMIFGREYFYDREDQTLKLMLDLPCLYLAAGTLDLSLEIGIMDRSHHLISKKLDLSLNWQPMAETGMSFQYLKLSDRKTPSKLSARVRGRLAQELAHANSNRWSQRARDLLAPYR